MILMSIYMSLIPLSLSLSLSLSLATIHATKVEIRLYKENPTITWPSLGKTLQGNGEMIARSNLGMSLGIQCRYEVLALSLTILCGSVVLNVN